MLLPLSPPQDNHTKVHPEKEEAASAEVVTRETSVQPKDEGIALEAKVTEKVRAKPHPTYPNLTALVRGAARPNVLATGWLNQF